MSEHNPDQDDWFERKPSLLVPRVWIGSLADLNDGRLHGRWIDADQPAEDIRNEITEVLATSPTPGAEEWGIFDHDGFEGLRLDEYEDLELVSTLAHGIRVHGPAYAYWAQIVECDGPMLEHFLDAYLGMFDSRVAYVEQLLDDTDVRTQLEAIPENLRRYVFVDTLGLSHDLEISGDVHFADHDGKVWVFDGRI